MRNLKLYRERSQLTQAELAEQLGTTQQTIARWESGKTEPSLAALRDLAICLRSTVDNLMGRSSVIENQTTNPLAWISGDTSGYWGNVGVRLPHDSFSRWYPITTATMQRLFSEIQSMPVDGWISFQTLNNKMVFCRPASVKALTFLDEAEDSIEGDWEVGPADVEGWPLEVYECLEHLTCERDHVPAGDQFSEKLIQLARGIIEEYDLDDEKLSNICSNAHVMYNDGTHCALTCSSERLADAVQQFDFELDAQNSVMLHLDDGAGEHSVFISLSLVSLVEFPLIVLKRGLERAETDFSNGKDD